MVTQGVETTNDICIPVCGQYRYNDIGLSVIRQKKFPRYWFVGIADKSIVA